MLRRANRLRSRSDHQRVTQQGGLVTAPEFVLYHFAREAPEVPRIGFAVSRRIGSSVVRNRARRILREAIRPLIPRLVACDIVVVARPPVARAGVGDLEKSLADAASRAGLLTTDRQDGANNASGVNREGTSS